MRARGMPALVVSLLCCAAAARGSTLLYLRGEAGDWVGDGATPPRWLDDANASIAAGQLYPGTFAFTFALPSSGETWSVYWTTNFGGAFAPGTYEIPGFL